MKWPEIIKRLERTRNPLAVKIMLILAAGDPESDDDAKRHAFRTVLGCSQQKLDEAFDELVRLGIAKKGWLN